MPLPSSRRQSNRPGRLKVLADFLWQELRPYPGRWRRTLKMTAAAVLAMLVGLAFRQTNVAYASLVAFLSVQEDWVKSAKIAISFPVIFLLGFGYSALVLNLFGSDPSVRFVAVALVTFVSLFLVQSATVGQPWILFGLLGESFLRSWDNGYPAESTVEGSLMTILTFASGGLAGVIISLLFPPRDAFEIFRGELARPFTLAANTLRRWSQDAGSPEDRKDIAARSLKGSAPLQEILEAAERIHPGLRQKHDELLGISSISVLLLDGLIGLEATRLEFQNQEAREAALVLAQECGKIAEAIEEHRPPPALEQRSRELMMHAPFLALSRTVALVQDVLTGAVTLPQRVEEHKNKTFFKPDAFTNVNYRNNAAKATAAALLCYAIIAGTDYPGISTAITTCFLTALSTVGQAQQKQSLRILGNILGALLGFSSLIWIIPSFSSVTGLSVLVAVGSIIAAWIFLSSARLSYAGLQFSLCFYLSVLGSDTIPTTLVPARDRVIGVLLGITTMWLIYDQIKPVWTADAARESLAHALESIAQVASIRLARNIPSEKTRQVSHERQRFGQNLANLLSMIDAQGYELNLTSAHQREKLPQLHHLTEQLQQLFSLQIFAVENELVGMEGSSADTGMKETILRLAGTIRDRTQPIRPAPFAGSGSIERDLLHQIELNLADMTQRVSSYGNGAEG